MTLISIGKATSPIGECPNHRPPTTARKSLMPSHKVVEGPESTGEEGERPHQRLVGKGHTAVIYGERPPGHDDRGRKIAGALVGEEKQLSSYLLAKHE